MRTLRNYLISFAIGLVVFFIGGNIIAGFFTEKNTSDSGTKSSNGNISQNNAVSESANIGSGNTFTAIVCGLDDNNELDALIFMKADKENKRFVISSIPTSYYTKINSTDSTTGVEKTTKVRLKDYPTRFPNAQYHGKDFPNDNKKFIDLICTTVHSITGMKVDYYAFIKADTVEALFKKTQALHYDVPEEIVYIGNGTEEEPEFRIKAGSQTFTWEKALNYMRFAYDNENDENENAKKRSERQVAFLESAIKQVLKKDMSVLIDGLGQILKSCDTNFSVNDFRNNAEVIATLGNSELSVVTIIYDELDYSKTQKLFENYK